MDTVPGGEKSSACRYHASRGQRYKYDGEAVVRLVWGYGSWGLAQELRSPLTSLGGDLGILTLVTQVGMGHELVNHQVHLPQLPGTEVLSASFVLQED